MPQTVQHAEGCDCSECTPPPDALTEAARSGKYPCLSWLLNTSQPTPEKKFDPLEIFDDDPLEQLATLYDVCNNRIG